jgi:serine/threonine protein kinase
MKILLHTVQHSDARQELQAMELIKGLRHPFLVQTQAYWLKDTRLHIVMELADGTLRDRLDECQREGQPGIPVGELISYVREAAEALDFLHACHVLHRDIKPANILLLKRHAKVADFGLARLYESLGLMSATSCGTPAYMAPEVWHGKVSPASDQYSLALTWTHLRLGRLPFAGQAMAHVYDAHQHGAIDLSALPAAERQVLLQALSRDPCRRYQSCLEFVATLEATVRPGRPAS